MNLGYFNFKLVEYELGVFGVLLELECVLVFWGVVFMWLLVVVCVVLILGGGREVLFCEGGEICRGIGCVEGRGGF